jgi:hypothetical protein
MGGRGKGREVGKAGREAVVTGSDWGKVSGRDAAGRVRVLGKVVVSVRMVAGGEDAGADAMAAVADRDLRLSIVMKRRMPAARMRVSAMRRKMERVMGPRDGNPFQSDRGRPDVR